MLYRAMALQIGSTLLNKLRYGGTEFNNILAGMDGPATRAQLGPGHFPCPACNSFKPQNDQDVKYEEWCYIIGQSLFCLTYFRATKKLVKWYR